jgi:ArsR family transcriptional regulator
MPTSTHELYPAQNRDFTLALNPVQDLLHSLVLLVRCDASTANEWAARTTPEMTPEECETNRLVVIGYHYAVVPERSWSSFPAYLDHLERLDPAALRQRLLNAYASMPVLGEPQSDQMVVSPQGTDFQAMCASPEAYLDFLRQRFEPKYVDEDLERQAFHHLQNPQEMHRLVTSHLRHMWQKYLSPEWEHLRPALISSLRLMQQVPLDGATRQQAYQALTGEEVIPGSWLDNMLAQAARLTFCPSAHSGPRPGKIHYTGSLWVLCPIDAAKAGQVLAPQMTGAEIITRLNALADANRLNMLRLVAERGELCSPEIITELEISQSAASRHLAQLTAAGFLSERRCDGSKCYTLNPERVEELFQSLMGYLNRS